MSIESLEGPTFYDAYGNSYEGYETLEAMKLIAKTLHAKVIGRTLIRGGIAVATDAMFTDLSLGMGRPLMFETMTFVRRGSVHKQWDYYDWKWPSREHAIEGHRQVAEALDDKLYRQTRMHAKYHARQRRR